MTKLTKSDRLETQQRDPELVHRFPRDAPRDLPSDQYDHADVTRQALDKPTQATYTGLDKRAYSTAFEKLIPRPRIRRTEDVSEIQHSDLHATNHKVSN
jgi:hypothetical protein